MKLLLLVFVTLFNCVSDVLAQVDTASHPFYDNPAGYITTIEKKIDRYGKRVNNKTIKTLEKLSHWELKIQVALQKINPQSANKLFSNEKLSFTRLLESVKRGEIIAGQYRAGYDKYRDQLTSGVKFLKEKNRFSDSALIMKLKLADKKVDALNKTEDQSQSIQEFIKQRKKELLAETFQYLGKNRYLSKINKEEWYYVETLKNYKEIFSNEQKVEQLVTTTLKKIPAFQKFFKQNSMLSGLFAQPGDMASANGSAGLQSRAGLQQLIQDRIGAGGGAQQLVSQQVKAAQGQLQQMKDKLINQLKAGGDDIPGMGFTPNMQRTKTFLQRLEYGFNLQFAKTNNFIPGMADIALTVGYKLNDKSVAGIGMGYKLGLGTIDNIKFSNQGISLRSFLDWKLKKQFFITGGYEINYLPGINTINSAGKNFEPWQQSALLGATKKIKIKTKWFKETRLQLLYDFLATQHSPVSEPLLFRIGYAF